MGKLEDTIEAALGAATELADTDSLKAEILKQVNTATIKSYNNGRKAGQHDAHLVKKIVWGFVILCLFAFLSGLGYLQASYSPKVIHDLKIPPTSLYPPQSYAKVVVDKGPLALISHQVQNAINYETWNNSDKRVTSWYTAYDESEIVRKELGTLFGLKVQESQYILDLNNWIKYTNGGACYEAANDGSNSTIPNCTGDETSNVERQAIAQANIIATDAKVLNG